MSTTTRCSAICWIPANRRVSDLVKVSGNRILDPRQEVALEEIRNALEGLRFGSLTVIVQDGIVVQIDTTSKSRVDYTVLDKVTGGEGI